MQAQSPAAAEVVEEVGLSLLTSSLDSTPRPQPVHDEQPDTSNAHRHSVVVEAEEPAHDSHLAAPAAELAPAPPAKPRSSGRSATRHRRAPNSATRAAPHEKMHGHALQEASSAGSGTQGAVPQQQRPTRHGSPVTSPIAVRAPSTHAESVREGGSDAGQEVLVIDPEAAPAPHKKEGDTKAKQPHAKESSVRSASPSHPSRDLREAKAPHPHKHATKRSPPKHSGHKRRRMPRAKQQQALQDVYGRSVDVAPPHQPNHAVARVGLPAVGRTKQQPAVPSSTEARAPVPNSHPVPSPIRPSQGSSAARVRGCTCASRMSPNPSCTVLTPVPQAAKRKRLAAQRREKVLNSTPYAQVQRPLHTQIRSHHGGHAHRSSSGAMKPSVQPAAQEARQEELKSKLIKASSDGDSFHAQLKQLQAQVQQDLLGDGAASLQPDNDTNSPPPAGTNTKEQGSTSKVGASATSATNPQPVIWSNTAPPVGSAKAAPQPATAPVPDPAPVSSGTTLPHGPGRRYTRRHRRHSGGHGKRSKAASGAPPHAHTQPVPPPPRNRGHHHAHARADEHGTGHEHGHGHGRGYGHGHGHGHRRSTTERQREGGHGHRHHKTRRVERLEAGWQSGENRFMVDAKTPQQRSSLSFLRLPSATSVAHSRKSGHGSASDARVALPANLDDQVTQVISQYDAKLASLTSRHAARIAVMNSKLRKMEAVVTMERKATAEAQTQAKRHRKRVAELQDLLSRVMPEREEAITRATTLQQQYTSEIKALQEKLRNHRKTQQSADHLHAESDRVVGQLLVHLEKDLTDLVDFKSRRGSPVKKRSSPAANNVLDMRRRQRLQRQQEMLHKLEWQVNRKQAQLVKLRRDQEAALVDVRVALANDFRAKEVEWTREKEALQQRIAQLEHQGSGAVSQLSSMEGGPTQQSSSPLSPVMEGKVSTGGGSTRESRGFGPLQPVVEYKPSQKHTDKSREDIKQMRRSLGTAQKVYKDAHTISTHYVVVSMLWRNATRRRLVISAFEPETNIEKTTTCSDAILTRRFDFDVVRSLRCMPSLSRLAQHQVALTVIDRLEIVEDEEAGSWELRLKRRHPPSHTGAASRGAEAEHEVSDESLHACTRALLSGQDVHIHVQWSPAPAERLQATAQETSGNFMVSSTFSDAALAAAFGADTTTELCTRQGSTRVAKLLASRLGVAAQARDGQLVLCLLPRTAATLPGSVLVRLVHQGTTGAVHLSVAQDQDSKALLFQTISLKTSTVFTLVLTHSELQPWVRTALGREDPTPLAKLPLHEQRQVAMYAVAKLQFAPDGSVSLRQAAEPVEEGFVPPWEKMQPVMERGICIGRGYAIVRVHWGATPEARLRLLCHNPYTCQEGLLQVSDQQLQLTLQVDATVLVTAKQRKALAEKVIRCIRWDGASGPVSLAL